MWWLAADDSQLTSSMSSDRELCNLRPRFLVDSDKNVEACLKHIMMKLDTKYYV